MVLSRNVFENPPLEKRALECVEGGYGKEKGYIRERREVSLSLSYALSRKKSNRECAVIRGGSKATARGGGMHVDSWQGVAWTSKKGRKLGISQSPKRSFESRLFPPSKVPSELSIKRP